MDKFQKKFENCSYSLFQVIFVKVPTDNTELDYVEFTKIKIQNKQKQKK